MRNDFSPLGASSRQEAYDRQLRPRPGDEPSTARVATPGHTYHGDTASQTPDRSGYYGALWKVRLTRLTHLTIRWSQPPTGTVQLNILPAVTDGDWASQQPLLSSNSGSNGRAAFVFDVAVTGWYYLDFVSESRPGSQAPGTPGPYTFSLGRVRRGL